MLRCCYVSGWGLGGVGLDKNVRVTCIHTWCYAAATSVVGGWVGWGEIITFMWLACIVRASLGIKKRKNGVPCLCTPVVSMECGKCSKVQPPCLPYVYTPPVHTFPSNVWKVGGAGGQARRRKEVSRRFIHYCFWSNETWGGPALHQHKVWMTWNNIKCIKFRGIRWFLQNTGNVWT